MKVTKIIPEEIFTKSKKRKPEEPILTLKTIFDYIKRYYPDLFFWDGKGKHEKRNPTKSYMHRQGMSNEIRIEFDSENKIQNWNNIHSTAINLWDSGYSFAVFYTNGGRSPHLHIYDIDELKNFELETRNYYRRMFLNKFCPKGSEPDFGLCDEKHLCALEFAPHFKYHKSKQLLGFFWQGRNQAMDMEIWNEIVFGKTRPEKGKKLLHKTRKKKFGDVLKQTQRDLIIDNLNFQTVFNKYNIEYHGTMALCPFHADSNRSLSFTNSNGLWKCWGCNEKGDIISLIQKLKEKSEDEGDTN